jgi:hypothetical protein
VSLPPSSVEFSSLHHSHKLSHSWLLGACRRSCPLRPGPDCLFTVPGGIPLHPSLAVRVSLLLCYVSLLFFLLITQFLFFPRVGVYADLAQGCLWKYHVLLSSPFGPRFPKPSGCGNLAASRGPPGFFVQREVEMLCAGWRCGGVKVLPLLGGLACKVCLQCLSKISL